jgi:hypothetical protein
MKAVTAMNELLDGLIVFARGLAVCFGLVIIPSLVIVWVALKYSKKEAGDYRDDDYRHK